MRVFLAGATGAIGAPLLRLLVAEGHEVTGMTRSPERAAAVRAAGAASAVADALDADAVMSAVAHARPEVVVHQLTAIPPRLDPRKIVRDFALDRPAAHRGHAHLVAAAQAAGDARVVAQSIAFAYAPGSPGTVHAEGDPLIADPPAQFERSAAAVAELERAVQGAGGVVLRYGYFYGPGTSIAARRRARRGSTPATAAGDRRRTRGVVIHPRRRCSERHRRRRHAWRPGRLQRRRRRARRQGREKAMQALHEC